MSFVLSVYITIALSTGGVATVRHDIPTNNCTQLAQEFRKGYELGLPVIDINFKCKRAQ